MTIYEGQLPSETGIAQKKIWLSFELSPGKNLDIKFDHRKRSRLSNGITRKKTLIFLVITSFSGDDENESHIFTSDTYFRGGEKAFQNCQKKSCFKKSCRHWKEAYLLKKRKQKVRWYRIHLYFDDIAPLMLFSDVNNFHWPYSSSSLSKWLTHILHWQWGWLRRLITNGNLEPAWKISGKRNVLEKLQHCVQAVKAIIHYILHKTWQLMFTIIIQL